MAHPQHPEHHARMPTHLAPMLATLSQMPSRQDEYAFEYKWDGVRAIAFWDGQSLRLQSRNILDITMRYPELAKLGTQLGSRPAILDGEVVAIEQGGRVSFSLLQRRMHLADPRDIARRMRDVPISYMIFDLLYLDGRLLLDEPLRIRRDMLEELRLEGPHWRLSPSMPGQGDRFWQSAGENELEGILAKKLTSRYCPGLRTSDWLKIKLLASQEFVIGGWCQLTGATRPAVGSLLIGYYDSGVLVYAGGVGTGFNNRLREDLARRLMAISRDTSPFGGPVPRPEARWVEPQLVAEVEFREWTPEGIVRHASFKGLRDDIPPVSVIREQMRKIA